MAGTEAAVPVSKAREELVTRRQYAYKARNEAATKIQTWYRRGYRTSARCREEALWRAETEHGRTAACESINRVKSDDLLSSNSSDYTVTPSTSKEENGTIREETSFDRYVANELAIALVMSGREPISTLNSAQKERVCRLREGMQPPPNRSITSGTQDSQSESYGRSLPVRRGKELSRIPVRMPKNKPPFTSRLNASRFKGVPHGAKKQGVPLREQGIEDNESLTKQILPVKTNKHQLAEHVSSNFKKSSHLESDSSFGSLDDQLQGEESSIPSQEEHMKPLEMKTNRRDIKAESVKVKSGGNLLNNKIILREYSTTSDSVSDDTLVASSREESHEHFRMTSLRKQTHNNNLPLVANRKPKFLVPLPKKKLARQRSNQKLIKCHKNPIESNNKMKNFVPVLVDAAVQTDEDSDSSCSPSHVRLPLSHGEQWSNGLSPSRGTASYSGVYAMKRQTRRKSVIRALKTPLCKPFEKKKATGYLQKYNKANKQLQSTIATTSPSSRSGFSPIYMENSISLLTIPQSNPLPEQRQLGGLHSNAPLVLHNWIRDQEGLLSQPMNYHGPNMSNYMNYWRRNKRT